MQHMFVVYQIIPYYSRQWAADIYTAYTPWNIDDVGCNPTDCVWMIPNTWED